MLLALCAQVFAVGCVDMAGSGHPGHRYRDAGGDAGSVRDASGDSDASGPELDDADTTAGSTLTNDTPAPATFTRPSDGRTVDFSQLTYYPGYNSEGQNPDAWRCTINSDIRDSAHVVAYIESVEDVLSDSGAVCGVYSTPIEKRHLRLKADVVLHVGGIPIERSVIIHNSLGSPTRPLVAEDVAIVHLAYMRGIWALVHHFPILPEHANPGDAGRGYSPEYMPSSTSEWERVLSDRDPDCQGENKLNYEQLEGLIFECRDSCCM